MGQSTDEPATSHPLIAEAFKYPDDYSSATYRLDPRAKWHDGTADHGRGRDLVVRTLKANSPMYNPLLRERHRGGGAERARGRVPLRPEGQPRTAAYHGRPDRAAEALVGGHGRGKGKKRDIAQPTLEPPLGSGAYRIESFKPARRSPGSRVPTTGAPTLPVNVGRNNFDRRRYVYFQDDNAVAGLHQGRLSRTSASRTARSAGRPNTRSRPSKAGDVIKEEFPQAAGEPMQGFVSTRGGRSSRTGGCARR
jgi:microcin C transport system substrate-binding protein